MFAKQTELERVHRGTGDGSRKRPAPEDDAADAEGYMPKFLTNPRLLEFEVHRLSAVESRLCLG